ncbi:MAG: AraC family transcriptional regulator [Flavipsychrobacter sp.]|nr:AraC family transcriptional regulator [Flavipsychrobacter sp.]
MDALSEVLDSLKLKAVVYQKVPFTAPWGISIAQDQYSQFWRLLKGTCYLSIAGEEMIKMEVGDFVLVPHGAAHRILGHPQNASVPSAQFVKSLQAGKPMFQGTDEETLLIGGHFEFTSPIQHPFVQSLPNVININSHQDEIRLWLQQAAAFMNDELSTRKAASDLILGRLAEIVFILIVRAYMEQAGVAQGFLRAFKDPRISASLNTMHAAPEKDWTLEQLATHVGMSRSLYSKEFKRLLGETPLGYLTNWRILKAKQLLLENKENICEVAEKVGYQSEAAFNRLFKTKVGETPAVYRRRVVA